MTLEQRGLFITMKYECWVNQSLPADPPSLSAILGKDVLTESLQIVMPYFEYVNGAIVCPELDDYKKHLSEIREKQSAGGKKGALRKAENQSQLDPNVDSQDDLEGDRKVSNKDKQRPDKQSQKQLIGNEFNYLKSDGTDPLDEELNKITCPRCDGEGCPSCQK